MKIKANICTRRKTSLENRNAFTLIELLAVIVILAIIALIATPIVLNIINDSKKSSDMRSIELYGKAIENAIGEYQVKNPQDSEITLEKIEPYITYKGNKVECHTQINQNGTIYLKGCKVDGKEITYTYGKPIIVPATEKNKTLAGKVPTGNFNLGEEYIINVDGKHEYHFYILSIEGDKVNLIMSRNICIDGTLATETNICRVNWVSKEDYRDDVNYGDDGNNNKGPITAMNYLYETTKDWSNIENINLNYTDEGNNYGGIKTTGNITTITMKDGTETSRYENLKARMIKILEMEGARCTLSYGTCPVWLVNGLNSTEYYTTGTKEDINRIIGYWSLSSSASTTSSVRVGSHYGSTNNHAGITGPRGIRPVITVSKSDLQ